MCGQIVKYPVDGQVGSRTLCIGSRSYLIQEIVDVELSFAVFSHRIPHSDQDTIFQQKTIIILNNILYSFTQKHFSFQCEHVQFLTLYNLQKNSLHECTSVPSVYSNQVYHFYISYVYPLYYHCLVLLQRYVPLFLLSMLPFYFIQL